MTKPSKRLNAICAVAALAAMPTLVGAAQQCVNLSGTYGAVSVTTACTGQPYQVINPSPLQVGGHDGILLSDPISDGPVTCTFTFNKPLNSASLRLYIDGQDTSPGITEERTAIAINGAAYTVAPADVSGPLAGGNGPLPITAIGGLINGPQPSGSGSGTFALGSSAPAALTSIAITYSGDMGTSLYSVCVDDATFAATGGAVAIPTLSQWGVITTSALLALTAAFWVRRRKSA